MKTPSPELILESLFDGVYCVDREQGIFIWNKSAERITGFSREEVLTKCCAANILQHISEDGENLCKKACPLSATMHDGKERQGNIYLHHKQGHRVPVSVRTAPILDASGAIVGALEVFTDNSHSVRVQNELEALKKEACLDALTGVGNRRYGKITLQTRIFEWESNRVPFGVVFFDVDNFKHINDNYGHMIGDEVLTMVAKTVGNLMRRQDVIARWGGDEFVAILHNVTQKDLQQIAERIRIFVARSAVRTGGQTIAVTASIGATLSRQDDTTEEIVQRADALMYASKSSGRDKVTIG